ncbi:unnamed protein product [Euphydryas editha]|uniref:Zinc finger BED domain-containing protein 1 n=1 Tax=Euphydryas editha TaxID=104508 RepID=A0AAU9UT99_EUPED|nr:unnamed protein product [Euphydryas editha]
MQKKLDEPILKLKQDVPTRWNSTCDMFKRFLKTKHSVMSTLAIDYPDVDNMNTDDIQILESTTEILSLFKDVTVILISNALKKKCTSFLTVTRPATVARMTETLSNEMTTRFASIEDNYIFSESTLLDPRFKKYGFLHEFAYDRTCDNLKALAGRIQIESQQYAVPEPTNSSPPSKRKGSIWDEFDQQVGDILKNTNPTAGGIIEVDKYLEEPLLPRSQDPAKWWLSKKRCVPQVSQILFLNFNL